MPDKSEPCYGFVIPLPAGEFIADETLRNSRMRELVNDLLRDNVSVFWLDQNLSVLTQGLYDASLPCTRRFKRGAVVVPFSGENLSDSMVISVVYDYNMTSEISDSSYQVPVFCLREPVCMKAMKLVEPRIAQYFGASTRYGLPVYLWVAEAGGFFSFEFLLDHETPSDLDIESYNVFMWPYRPHLSSNVETVRSLTNTRICNAVRSFVSSGGGYIGSCYGAAAASAGFLRPVPIFSLRHFYLPRLYRRHPFVSFSLSDTVMSQSYLVLQNAYVSHSEVAESAHPLVAGINRTVTEFFTGPWFVWLGDATQTHAVFSEFEFNQSISPPLAAFRKIQGTPSWVSSQFGDGRVVLFSSHPEFVNNISFLLERYNWQGDPFSGRRVVHNALWYVTGQQAADCKAVISQPIAFVSSVCMKTRNLDISYSQDDIFEKIHRQIIEMNHNISQMYNQSRRLLQLYITRFDNTVFASKAGIHSYIGNLCKDYVRWNNKTQQTLQVLNSILQNTDGYENRMGELDTLLHDLQTYIFDAGCVIQDVFERGNRLEKRFGSSQFLFSSLYLFSQSRTLLRTFHIVLKYLPQMYFSSEKFMRTIWHSYEASMGIAS